MTENFFACVPKSFVNEICCTFAVITFVADNTIILPTLSVREQSTLNSQYVPRSCNAGLDKKVLAFFECRRYAVESS